MKRIIIYIFVLLICGFFGFAHAGDDTSNLTAYISFLSGNVEVDLTPDNELDDFEPAELGTEVFEGTLIRTGRDALCEVQMPDGSSLKISNGSVFRLEKIVSEEISGTMAQRFKLLFGRVRAKVEKLKTPDSRFEIVSGTSLAGVRGTDYGVNFDGEKSNILVFDGKVGLESLTGSFEEIEINAGEMSFVPPQGVPQPVREIPADVVEEWNEELQKFSTETVQEVREPEEEVEKQVDKKKSESALRKLLELNAYVGSITIDGDVYARWVFSPEISIGKLGIGLFLPAIFAPDVGIFGFEDWYNHDEWDFRDFNDSVNDLSTKFLFIQYAQQSDPFYFRVGGIDDFYLGHGFIVDGYSNMIYFPEQINTGIQLNIDAESFGFETIVAQVARFQAFGGRVFLRPAGSDFPLEFGATVFHDRPKPQSSSWPAMVTDEDQLPRLFFVGIDTGFPLLRSTMFSALLYANAAKLGYGYREVPPALTIYGVEAGKLDFVKGLGTGVGVKGKLANFILYGFEYRYIFNYFEPGIINSLWENRRLTYAQELQDLIIAQEQPTYKDTKTSGVLISGGVELMHKLELGAEYEDYKRVSGTGEEPVKRGKLYARVHEGLIPRVYGSLSYTRTENLADVFDDPFNEDTVLEGMLTYQLAPVVALRFSYNRTYQYNDETAVFDPVDSFGITTIFTFF
jgi:hypothetical protein